MARFLYAAVSSLLLLADPSSSANLRSIVEHGRRLSYELITFYEPKTQVTDHNALDLDQDALEAQLGLGTDASFANARRIYEQGGHSKSVAQLQLSSGLPVALDKSAEVSGQSASGVAVYGKLYASYAAGATTIEVQYTTTDSQKNYVQCQVGGLSQPNLVGCFADSGNLDIGGTILNYSYDSRSQNVNKRTLQKFSTEAEKKMYRCENCPYATYQKFRDYYGFFDYADKWITAAFDGTGTSFARGNANFVRYGFKGRSEAIKKATAYMSVWMYVIRELEDALDDCNKGCSTTGCNDDPVRAWDEAVAFYSGSLEGTDGSGSGKFLYALADKRCQNFKTCGPLASSTEGTSHVNEEIFRSFALGARLVANGKCGEARVHKERIEQMMTVPLIQGTLRYAYITATDPTADEKAESEGAIFAASILPIIHACDEDAAEIVFENMKTQKTSTDFAKTKRALESVYDCMGVRGKDVGGLWDADLNMYFPGAKPLNANSGPNVGLIVGCTVGGLFAGIFFYMFVSKCCCRSATPVEFKDDLKLETDGTENPSAIMSGDDAMPSTDSQCEPVEIS